MSGLPPKPDFESREDDRRSSPHRPERSDHERRASSSRGPPPLADSYIALAGDTYVPRHDERSRRPSPPPRSWRDPPRRDPPPRREEWRHRDEPISGRRDYPPRSREYPRGGPRDRDWRRERDYDDRDRRYSRRSPSPYDRNRRWPSRGSPSPPRRSTYDYRRHSPPYHSRRSASPPRCRRPSPGRREDGRFSPRRPPPRDDDREGRPNHRRSRSRSRTRSRTPRAPAPRLNVHSTEPASEAPIQGADVAPPPASPHHRKPANRSIEPQETHLPKPSIPAEAELGPTVDTDITMVDIRPPTQPKAFAVSTTAPPTQPKSFNRPPPTGPRLVPTATGQLPPPRQPRTPETSSAPEPTQPDTGPATTGTPSIEEPEITLPQIEPFLLIPEESKRDAIGRLEKTIDELLRKSYLMRAEYGETLKAARKAMHELDMSEIESAGAKMRREVADSQLEKARLGLLGIDYDGVSGLATNE